jgi:hypothetical protein
VTVNTWLEGIISERSKCFLPALPHFYLDDFAMFHQLTKYLLHFLNEHSTIPDTGATRIPLNTLLIDSDELVVITPYQRPTTSNARAHLSLWGIWSSSQLFALPLRTFYNSTSASLKFSLVRHPHSDFNFYTTSFFFYLLLMLVAKCLMHHRCLRGGHPERSWWLEGGE